MLVKAASRCLMGVRCLAFAALLARALPGQMLPLDRLRSPVDSVRAQAFYKILNLANPNNNSPSLRPRSAGLARFARSHPELVPALASLLELENIRVQSPSLGEEYSNYYGDLIGCVAALRDARAATGLLGAIATGNMAIQGLAALGDVVVPGVIRASRAQGETNVVTRDAAVFTIGEMVHGVNGARLSNSATAAVREALFPALRDEDPMVRLTALDAIVVFHDDSVRTAVDRLSRSDPFTKTSAGRSTYPIREKAASYLATMPPRSAPLH
jgi:hypothetical protein